MISEVLDVCVVCAWIQNEVATPEAGSEANGVSLLEAQRNFSSFGAKTRANLKTAIQPTQQEVRDAHWKPHEDSKQPAELLTCFCCGYKSVTGEFDICAICLWQKNAAAEATPHSVSVVNGVALREAQQNFNWYGAMTESLAKEARKPSRQDVRDPNWKPLEIFTCPCCGYKTIATDPDVCDICMWMHDTAGVMQIERDLRESQRNFARFGACEKVVSNCARRLTSLDVRDPAWKPLK
jgi:hypothetical protein